MNQPSPQKNNTFRMICIINLFASHQPANPIPSSSTGLFDREACLVFSLNLGFYIVLT